ncbi:MAG: RNA-directed DNA polymerase [Candidatus Aerophobetes bacterium]|nr:RNA-directed DNA polymerase [Candidatus Aerophobetes bacterium]
MSWIEKLDFEKAVREICKEERQGKDLCLDPLRFEDLSIKSVREILIKTAKEKVKNGTPANSLIEIDVPKSNYILRPGARPNVLDWAIYETTVNFIGEKIYRLIPECSYSFNRFREQFKRGKQKRKIEHWLDFGNKTLEYSKKYRYMLVTDITSFFENISLDVLKERLLTLKTASDYASGVKYLIENILKPWTTSNKVKNFGLPQGPSASSVLADIYLYSVDREMGRNKIKFIRYMDDMRIFTKDKADLKRALKYLVRSLRDLKLNLNSKKTDIYDTQESESLKRVFDPERGRLDLIDRAFNARKAELIRFVIPSLF